MLTGIQSGATHVRPEQLLEIIILIIITTTILY